MPTQVTNYQCPSCTGPLHFSGASGRLECEYCGASYDVAEIEALYAEKEGKAAAAQQSAEEKAAAINSAAKVEAEALRAETEEMKKAAADYRARFLRLVEDQVHILKADDSLYQDGEKK